MFKQFGNHLRSWRGSIGQKEYLLVGVSLSIVKVLCDYATVTIFFGRKWSWVAYVTSRFSLFAGPHTSLADPAARAELLTMAAVAISFMYVGVLYTVKRLRDAGAPTWWAAFFFVPFLKFVLIFSLCLLPTIENMPERSTSAARLGSAALSRPANWEVQCWASS
jgi:uncharacterized membrane protein YhaH (DUF805 family)